MAANDSSSILLSQEGPTAVVELNRPKALNALSTQVMNEVVDAVLALDSDASVRAIIITGRGKAFAAGADIKEMASLDEKQCHQQQLFGRWRELASGRKCHTPLIAAVNGFALGGGTELALMCDIIIASTTASFGLPEPTLGVIPGIGGTQRLPRLIGRVKATDLMLTAGRLSAAEALTAGLVSRVVPPEQLMAEAHHIAQKIASMPAGAVSKILMAVQGADSGLGLQQGLDYERELFYSCFGTADQQEGMVAFLEKRQAVWQQQKEPL
eukprot:gene8548-8731_t